MSRSANTWTKNRTASGIIGISSNTFSTNKDTDFIAKSSNSFSKGNVVAVSNASGWDGENITSNAYGFDDLWSGTAYGGGEFGGIRHFEKIKDRD